MAGSPSPSRTSLRPEARSLPVVLEYVLSAGCATVHVSVSILVNLPTCVSAGKDGCVGVCVCVCARARMRWVTVPACFDKRVTKSLRFVSFGDWVCVCVNIRCVRAFRQA